MADLGTMVCVGDKLSSVDVHAAGPGTYIMNGQIHASLVGVQRVLDASQDASGSNRPILEVVSKSSIPLTPKPGDIVTGKILRVQQNSAHCRIACIGSQALDSDFSGVIRLQDTRATEIDKIVMHECFRPGDIVRAEVLSLGDVRSYYLTTAKNDLGVVYARSVAAGQPMVAISWEEMQCPTTQTIEKRKLAKLRTA